MSTVKQLSSAGVGSFLKRGGVLTLYRKGCPSCNAVHTRGSSSSVMQRLAELMDAEGDTRHSCVANTERVLASLPADAQSAVSTYPAIFIADGSGRMEPYTGPRTAEAMYGALRDMDSDADDTPAGDGPPAGELESVGTVAELRAVMEQPGRSAVIWLPCHKCDAASRSDVWATAKASLEAVATHPSVVERRIRVVATTADVAQQIKDIPTSGVAQLPATFLVQRGTDAYTVSEPIEPNAIVSKIVTLHDTPAATEASEMVADRNTAALLYDDVARWARSAPPEERAKLQALLSA